MESEGADVGEEKPLDADSKIARNFAVNHSDLSSGAEPSSSLIAEDISQANGIQESENVSEGSRVLNESENAPLSEVNSSECVEEDGLTLKELKNDDKVLSSAGNDSLKSEELSEAIVKTSKPLCADYRSGSDSESVDSESDSSTSTDDTSDISSESEEEDDESQESDNGDNTRRKEKQKKADRDLALSDLPPIEDLKITVPENACVEVGQISSIVDTLVVVESYKGTAALDVDTVLFLDCGKRSLGKVFDILGPITEPVYTVRFNSQDQIQSLNIEKGQKVYYAPKTQHTMFVFLSEVLKNRGSDASWKDNIEAPSEFQDFSDDEEERLYKNKQKRESNGEDICSKESNQSRKRSFSRTKQTPGIIQPSRFRHPGVSMPRKSNPPRHPSANQFVPPNAFSRPHFPSPLQPPPFPYTPPPYPPNNLFTPAPPIYHPPTFSGPPFPTFGGLPFPNQSRPFHPPFFQQRAHPFPQFPGRPWGRPILRPPPPPPPPDPQNLEGSSDGKL